MGCRPSAGWVHPAEQASTALDGASTALGTCSCTPHRPNWVHIMLRPDPATHCADALCVQPHAASPLNQFTVANTLQPVHWSNVAVGSSHRTRLTIHFSVASSSMFSFSLRLRMLMACAAMWGMGGTAGLTQRSNAGAQRVSKARQGSWRRQSVHDRQGRVPGRLHPAAVARALTQLQHTPRGCGSTFPTGPRHSHGQHPADEP